MAGGHGDAWELRVAWLSDHKTHETHHAMDDEKPVQCQFCTLRMRYVWHTLTRSTVLQDKQLKSLKNNVKVNVNVTNTMHTVSRVSHSEDQTKRPLCLSVSWQMSVSFDQSRLRLIRMSCDRQLGYCRKTTTNSSSSSAALLLTDAERVQGLWAGTPASGPQAGGLQWLQQWLYSWTCKIVISNLLL